MSRILVVMAKAPAPGKVKTRLCPPLSMEEAAELHRRFVLDTLDKLASAPGLGLVVAYTPTSAAHFFKEIAPAGACLIRQTGWNLGERMSHCFETLCAPDRCVVMIGADSPTLPPDSVHTAFAALEQRTADVVLGPAEDGGYYLVGMNSPQPTLFEGVEWSTGSVLQATLDRAERLGLRTHLLKPHYDIDTAADLARLAAELAANEETHLLAPRTAEYVAALRARLVRD